MMDGQSAWAAASTPVAWPGSLALLQWRFTELQRQALAFSIEEYATPASVRQADAILSFVRQRRS